MQPMSWSRRTPRKCECQHMLSILFIEFRKRDVMLEAAGRRVVLGSVGSEVGCDGFTGFDTMLSKMVFE